MLSTDKMLYGDISSIVNSSVKYTPSAILEEGEWFFLENAKTQSYSEGIIDHDFESVDFDSLDRNDFDKIDFLFVIINENVYFQNVSKSRLITKKSIMLLGEDFEYRNDQKEIMINDLPDAIYAPSEDRLYFRRLESITGIFKGIDQIYKEATFGEVDTFLKNDFISVQEGYSVSNVKTANRKRIALATKTLNELNETDRKKIFIYISDYCPNLKTNNNAFEIGTEDEMKMLLFGIEQRFYTTPVGGEKRLANSVIPLK